jgi:hypothetical protein
MEGMHYEVVSGDPEVVRPELCRLWRENLTLHTTPESHFQWLYRDAPEPTSTVFLLRAGPDDPAHGAAQGAAQIVGSNGFSIRRFQLAPGVDGRAAVIGDLTVERPHRSLLPALRLVQAVRDHMVDELAFCYGFPNQKAKGVMARAGFRVLGKTTRYARVLRHATYLPEIAARLHARPRLASIAGAVVHHRILERALAPVLDVARLAAGLPDIARARTRYRLTWLDEIDARFDDLWQRARPEYDVIGARTAAMLRWRYPHGQIATLVRSSDRALVAYALLERDAASGAAEVRDVFGHKSALGPLFDLLLPALWRRGAISISIRVLGAPYLVAVLVERGFEPRPKQRTVVVHVGRGHQAERARLENADAWHLLDLDEDT